MTDWKVGDEIELKVKARVIYGVKPDGSQGGGMCITYPGATVSDNDLEVGTISSCITGGIQLNLKKDHLELWHVAPKDIWSAFTEALDRVRFSVAPEVAALAEAVLSADKLENLVNNRLYGLYAGSGQVILKAADVLELIEHVHAAAKVLKTA
jgi:hypothetical protein